MTILAAERLRLLYGLRHALDALPASILSRTPVQG